MTGIQMAEEQDTGTLEAARSLMGDVGILTCVGVDKLGETEN
jgi:hypothetical protein